MSEQLAGLFGSAVGMLQSSPTRSLEMFTEITASTRPLATHGSDASGAATPTG